MTETADEDEKRAKHRYPPALIASAVALPVALVVGVVVAAVIANKSPAKEPVVLGTVPAPKATSQECQALIAALPNELGDYSNAELSADAPPATKAWQSADGGEPIVARCGLDRPLEFTVGAALQDVNMVTWFKIDGAAQQLNASTWFAVDRAVYVALTLPNGTGPTPVQLVSEAIKKALPAVTPDPAPLPN
ncbi:DUF3515 family protein [Antrihabitans stalactiti]|uniref:DUF3515 domain-containing protein n=1 Tax=Antrihabitans stalactiti TaxID=2584121 RepID=A0A848KB02_9NOCA|nr:DUF3515 domain-containing protein [Antrihabitans stalactiti]